MTLLFADAFSLPTFGGAKNNRVFYGEKLDRTQTPFITTFFPHIMILYRTKNCQEKFNALLEGVNQKFQQGAIIA
jgi:hypothetical protein